MIHTWQKHLNAVIKKEVIQLLWSKPISVIMPQEQVEYLDEVAEKYGKSRAEIIRAAIDLFRIQEQMQETVLEKRPYKEMKCQMAQPYGSNVRED